MHYNYARLPFTFCNAALAGIQLFFQLTACVLTNTEKFNPFDSLLAFGDQ